MTHLGAPWGCWMAETMTGPAGTPEFKKWFRDTLFASKRKEVDRQLADMTAQEREQAWRMVWNAKRDSYRAYLEKKRGGQYAEMDKAASMGPALKQTAVKTAVDTMKLPVTLGGAAVKAGKDVYAFGQGQANLTAENLRTDPDAQKAVAWGVMAGPMVGPVVYGASRAAGALLHGLPQRPKSRGPVLDSQQSQRETFKNALTTSLGVTYNREVGEPRHITSLRGLVARGKATPAQRTELAQFDSANRGANITGIVAGLAPQIAAPSVGISSMKAAAPVVLKTLGKGLLVGAGQTGAGVAIRRMTDKPGPKTAEEAEDRRLFDLIDAVGNMGPLALIEGGKAIYRLGGAARGIVKSRKAAKTIARAKTALATAEDAPALARAATEAAEEVAPTARAIVAADQMAGGRAIARTSQPAAAPAPAPRHLADAPDEVHNIRAKYAGQAQEGVDQAPTAPLDDGLDDDIGPVTPFDPKKYRIDPAHEERVYREELERGERLERMTPDELREYGGDLAGDAYSSRVEEGLEAAGFEQRHGGKNLADNLPEFGQPTIEDMRKAARMARMGEPGDSNVYNMPDYHASQWDRETRTLNTEAAADAAFDLADRKTGYTRLARKGDEAFLVRLPKARHRESLNANPPSAIVRVGQAGGAAGSILNAPQALWGETPEERRAAQVRALLFGGLAGAPVLARAGGKAIARTGARASLGKAAGLALDAWEHGAPEMVKRSAQGAAAHMLDAGTIAGGVKRGVEGALADSAGSVGQTMRQVLMKKPEGRALVRPIEDVREYADILAFRDMQDLAPKLDALKRANRQEYNDFWQYVEAGQAPASQEGQAAFYSWQRIHNALADAAEELGVEVEGDAFKRVQNYFPRQILPKVRLQITGRQGPIFEAVQAWALQNRGQKWWQEFEAQLKHAVTVNPETYFTAHRIADLPPVIEWEGQTIKLMETDPTKVFTRHVRRANHRLAAYDLLGQDVAGNRWTFEVRMRPPMVAEKAPGMEGVQATSMVAQRPQRDVVLYRETNWQAAEAMRDEALRVAGPDASVYVVKRRIHPWNSPEGVINGKLAAAQGAFDSGTGVFSDRLRLLVGRELGAIPEPPGSPILQTVRNLETAVKLPLAVLSNSLQTLQTTLPAFGAKATGRAVFDRAALGARDTLKRFEPVFTRFPAARGVYDAALGFADQQAKRGEMQLRTVLATGLHLDDYSNITETLMDAAEGSGVSGWLAGQVLQKSGFEWVERNNRLIAGFAAMNSYADMARALKNGQRPVLTALREGAGVNPAELARIRFERAGFVPEEVAEIAQRGYLTPREMTKAIRHGVEDTQFMGLTTLDTPTAFNNEVLKTMFQFKRFGARYAAFSVQMAQDAWRTKDPTLALKLLAGGVIGGGIIRDQIMQQLNARRDNENEWTDYLAKMVWYSGMLGPVVDMVTGRKASDIASAVLGPGVGDTLKVGGLAARFVPFDLGMGLAGPLAGMTAGKAITETAKGLSPALRVPVRQWEAYAHPDEATMNASRYMFRDFAAERQATASDAQKANAKDELWRAAMRPNEQARMEEMAEHAGRLLEAIGNDPAELEDALLREIDARNPLQPLAVENRPWAAARASGGRMDDLALEGVAAHGKVTAQYLTALVGMGALGEQAAQQKLERMQQRMAEQIQDAQTGGATQEELAAMQGLYEAWQQGFMEGMGR